MYLNIEKKPFDKIAVIQDDGQAFSYGELVKFTQEWRQWIPQRELIFILCANNMATIAGHVASIENKTVPLMISEKMDSVLLDRLIVTYRPKFIWVKKEHRLLEERSGNVCFNGIICNGRKEKYGYLLLETEYESAKMYDGLSLLLTTSGSTGSPKLIRHNYRNLFFSAESSAKFLGLQEQDKSLIDLQLHYTMGLNVACSSLYAGAALMMTDCNAMQNEYWNFWRKGGITNMTGVPYSYELLKKLKFFKQDFPNLRILAQGGGKLTDELFQEVAEYARERNKTFFATFGTSETTSRLAYLSPDMALKKIGSIGKAIPNGRLFLVDENGIEITQIQAEGELAYQGENVTLGYAMSREDLSKADERNGIYYTGDLARRDIDGYYFICGRKSRFLKLYGHRVGLDECERLIKTEFKIECACVGTDKKMIICITGKENINVKDIREYIAEMTGISKTAYEVRTIDKIPKNEVGKILYRELQNKI